MEKKLLSQDATSYPEISELPLTGLFISRETKGKSSSCDELDSGTSMDSGSGGGGGLRGDYKGSSRPSLLLEPDRHSLGSSSIGSSKETVASFCLPDGLEQFLKLDEGPYDPNAIKKLQQGRFELTVEIIETGIVSDKGKTYGIYAVAVTKVYDSGYQEKWHIYRR